MNLIKLLWRWFSVDWHEIVTAVLVWLFLYQFAVWLRIEKILLPVTNDLISYILGFTLLTELLTFIPRGFRNFLQFAAIVAVHLLVLDYRPVAISFESVDSAVQSLYMNLAPLAPYVIFGMGTWILFSFTLWMVQEKWRIYTIMIVSVLCFAIRDSFSKVVLWEQVAIIMFCGLAILILRHFVSLKEKNPSGWSYFAEYPMSIAGPTATLLLSVFALGILAPEARPLLTDPYTWWMNSKGQAVITDGKGFISAGGPVGNSSSGYSRNDESLGGEFDFDYTPIMNVDTTFRGYWRGETRSLYTGKGWESTDAERRAALTPVSVNGELSKDGRADTSRLETREVRQTISIMETEQQFPVLFGAAGIVRLEGLDEKASAGLRLLRWAPVQQELRWDPRAKDSYPEIYSVISQVPIMNEKLLREAPVDFPNKARFAEELQLPNTVPERVKSLAAEITQNATNPYDKIKLLEAYLNTNFKYTNEPDVSKGRSRDFVDRFLFEIQEGYCDYFSSAFVVMARSLDIPARWVKGYSSGYIEDEEFLTGVPQLDIDPDRAGIYTVRNSDAHSWAEVYFEGFGWISFEPTAGFVLPTALPEGEVMALPDIAALPAVETSEEGTFAWGWVTSIAGGLIAAAALIWLYLRREDLLFMLRRRNIGSIGLDDVNQRIVYEFERFLRYAKRKGYRREEHETAREMTERWVRTNGYLRGDLEKLLRLFEKAKYSPISATDDDLEQTVRIVKVLREQF
jgi:transglutaminase-like putative cysteine protease